MGILQRVLCALLFWLPWALLAAPAKQDPACGDCYRIDNPTLVGIIIGDIVLTVIIILVVYYFTKQRFQNQQNNDDKKVYMNMPMNR